MSTASTLDELRPRLGELVRSLGSDREAEVIATAREMTHALTEAGFDLGTLAAIIANTAEPIIVPPTKSSRSKAGDPTFVRMRLAERLMQLDANPRVDLDRWSRDFIVSAVTTLRADLPLSKAQEVTVKRLFKIPRRRLR